MPRNRCLGGHFAGGDYHAYDNGYWQKLAILALSLRDQFICGLKLSPTNTTRTVVRTRIITVSQALEKDGRWKLCSS